jgi:hypothetical protein
MGELRTSVCLVCAVWCDVCDYLLVVWLGSGRTFIACNTTQRNTRVYTGVGYEAFHKGECSENDRGGHCLDV